MDPSSLLPAQFITTLLSQGIFFSQGALLLLGLARGRTGKHKKNKNKGGGFKAQAARKRAQQPKQEAVTPAPAPQATPAAEPTLAPKSDDLLWPDEPPGLKLELPPLEGSTPSLTQDELFSQTGSTAPVTEDDDDVMVIEEEDEVVLLPDDDEELPEMDFPVQEPAAPVQDPEPAAEISPEPAAEIAPEPAAEIAPEPVAEISPEPADEPVLEIPEPETKTPETKSPRWGGRGDLARSKKRGTWTPSPVTPGPSSSWGFTGSKGRGRSAKQESINLKFCMDDELGEMDFRSIENVQKRIRQNKKNMEVVDSRFPAGLDMEEYLQGNDEWWEDWERSVE